ncbi:PRD domain-containing protein [Paenibacillus larvae]
MEQRKLQMKKSRGELSILGNELDKRTAYLELARKDLSEERMLQFLLLEPSGRSIDMKGWNQWFPNEDIYFVIDVVRCLETNLHIEFSGGSHSALILHILMAMERLKRQFAIQMDRDSLLELRKTKEYNIVKTIAIPR